LDLYGFSAVPPQPHRKAGGVQVGKSQRGRRDRTKMLRSIPGVRGEGGER
jgi:hypothetical protein